MFPFRLTNRPCLMLLVLCSSSCYFWRQSFQCKVWLHHVHIHEQCMYPFQHKILNVLHVLPTAVHACSWYNSSSKIEYSVCTIISSAFNNLLSTFTFTKEYIYKTSERHVQNSDITPPLYIEHYRYYVNDYSTKIIQSSKPSS